VSVFERSDFLSRIARAGEAAEASIEYKDEAKNNLLKKDEGYTD
jgi:hypothetical protein